MRIKAPPRLERIVQISHCIRDLDIDRILISEAAPLDTQNEAKLLNVGGKVRQGKRDLLSFGEIVDLEGVKVADQDVARLVSLRQAVEISPTWS